MAVSILNLVNRKIKTGRLQRAARKVLQLQGAHSAEVSILITDDTEIQAMNCQYRRIDSPTDVLSFSQRDGSITSSISSCSLPGPEILGDVVISLDTAKRQALQHGFPLEDELALLAVHGILHLLGYDDETVEGSLEMRSHERQALEGISPAAWPEARTAPGSIGR